MHRIRMKVAFTHDYRYIRDLHVSLENTFRRFSVQSRNEPIETSVTVQFHRISIGVVFRSLDIDINLARAGTVRSLLSNNHVPTTDLLYSTGLQCRTTVLYSMALLLHTVLYRAAFSGIEDSHSPGAIRNPRKLGDFCEDLIAGCLFFDYCMYSHAKLAVHSSSFQNPLQASRLIYSTKCCFHHRVRGRLGQLQVLYDSVLLP